MSGGGCVITQIDENLACFHLHGMGFQVNAGGRTLGLAGGEVKPSVVLRTFDDVVHNEAAREMDVGVGTETIRGVLSVLRSPVNGEGAAVVVEADYVFLFDLTDAADFNPGLAHRVTQLRWLQRRNGPGGARQFAMDEIGWVFQLPDQRGDNLPVGFPEAAVWLRHVGFQFLV